MTPLIDIVMLSWAKDSQKKRMTERAINSIIASERENIFNIIVVETDNDTQYRNAHTVNPKKPFRYNEFLRIGFEHFTDAPYFLLLNNDIEARQGFATRLCEGLKFYASVSPACPRIVEHKSLKQEYSEGFTIFNPYRLCGWAIMHKKELFDLIPVSDLYDDRFVAWYSDNAYGYMLQKHGLKHAVVKSAKLDHLGTQTLHGLDQKYRDSITWDQAPVFEEWKKEIDLKYP